MKNAKQKGNRGEREIIGIVARLGDERITAHRNLQGLPAAMQGGGFVSGVGCPDVLLTVNGAEVHAEIKRTERLQLHKALEQAIHDCNGRIPAVIHRRNRERWYITLGFTDFITLVTKGGTANA